GMIERVVGRLRIDVGYAVYFSNWFASLFILCVFFFSSRRRHTRCLSDWSSDVCSSDLSSRARSSRSGSQQVARILFEKLQLTPGRKGKTGYSTDTRVLRTIRGEHEIVEVIEERSEERRVGKAGRGGVGRGQRTITCRSR